MSTMIVHKYTVVNRILNVQLNKTFVSRGLAKVNEIAKRIQHRRRELNLTQEELAAIMGVDTKNVSRYENGENKPSAERLADLANALNTTPNWLLGFNDDDLQSDERLMLDLYRSKDNAHKDQLLKIAQIV